MSADRLVRTIYPLLMPSGRVVVRKKKAAYRKPARSSKPMVSEAVANRAVSRVMSSFGATPAALAADRRRTAARRAALGGVAKMLGSALGGYLGGPTGAAMAGNMLSHIGGSGDYVTNSDRVKYNVLVNEGQVPQFGSSKNAVHIRHREFLGDIISSSSANTFQVQTFNINPGLSSTFPWLSQVCGATFQQYRINGMIFEFRSMSADALNSTNTALGSVVMATDYDSADAAFTSKAQMENSEFGVSCKPSSCMIHAVECARTQTSISEQYVRATSVPTGADIRLYDLGKFYIATTGFQGTSVNVGELWVSYDITLLKAIQQPPGYLQPLAHYPIVLADAATKPFSVGTAYIDNLPLTFASNGLSFTMPLSIPLNSIWMVQLTQEGTAAAATVLTYTYSNGLVAYNSYRAGHGAGAAVAAEKAPGPSGLAGTTNVFTLGVFQYTGGGTPSALPTVAIAAPGTPLASYLFGDLFVFQLNGNAV